MIPAVGLSVYHMEVVGLDDCGGGSCSSGPCCDNSFVHVDSSCHERACPDCLIIETAETNSWESIARVRWRVSCRSAKGA